MVRRATNIEDIMPIVNEIRLETIQQLAIQHIDTLNTNSLRQLTCKATSINDIFSSDIIQYILSFTNNIDPYTNLVCKTWDVLSNKNKVKYAKDLYSSTGPNEQQRNKMPYNYQHNTTYIIDQSRKTLFAAEEQKGYQMDPYFNTKYYSLYNYQRGDRIFILNQGDKQPMIDGEITADIQIIGTKNRATLGYIKITAAADYEQDYEEYIPSKVYLEGITVTTINLRAHCSLWMQNCIIGDIFVRERANLNLDNCEVKGKLQITPFADNVSITNCKLGNIYIRTSAGEEFTNGSGDLNIEWSLYLSEDELVNFTCVGNVFTAHEPITELANSTCTFGILSDKPHKYTIKNNEMLVTDESNKNTNNLLANVMVCKSIPNPPIYI